MRASCSEGSREVELDSQPLRQLPDCDVAAALGGRSVVDVVVGGFPEEGQDIGRTALQQGSEPVFEPYV
jgi:hypothetical protein